MKEPVSFTPETKNELEIRKLHAELCELRSSVRRWAGWLTSFAGLLTVGVSVAVTLYQLSQSKAEHFLREKKLDAQEAEIDKKCAEYDRRLAKEEADKAKNEKKVAEDSANEALKEKMRAENQVSATLKKLTDMQEKLKTSQDERELAIAQAGDARLKMGTTQDELKAARAELERVRAETAKLADSLPNKSQAVAVAKAATEIVSDSKNLVKDEQQRVRLADDNTKARLFCFVLDSEQKENAWRLGASLQTADPQFVVANVLAMGGRREDTPVLRYFRIADKAEAEKLRDVLIELGLEKTRASYVNDADSAGTGRKYQLWVRKENLRNHAPERPFDGELTLEVHQYTIVSQKLRSGRWLNVYVANPNDDEPFRCVAFTSVNDESTGKDERKVFTAPPGSLFDESISPDKLRSSLNQEAFERNAFGGRLRVTVPSSSFRKATLQISWQPK